MQARGLCHICYQKLQKSPDWAPRVPMTPEEEREKGRLKRARQRAELLAAYGGKCSCCGESEPAFLNIDHIYGGGSKERSEKKNTLTRQVRMEGYPRDKYRLLCANCNFGTYINKGICPHQVTERAGYLAELAAFSF